jgi:maltooligosyltrehalose trehalohydrolase
VDARVGVGLGVLLTKERRKLATPPKPSVLEHLVSPKAAPVRRLPIGAEPQPHGGVHFRVWAPRCREVVVEIEGLEPAALQPETHGYFSLRSMPARSGLHYRLRLDQGEAALPDPASRFQPEGPHGPSQIVDPEDFDWTDEAWRGVAREHLVIYEMHVGTFTPEGSWDAALRELPALAELGITCLEIMPVAEFPGQFGWGYDGVNLFAPTRLYGQPVDFRRFVDRAHALGIAVILDVVYNHFGPDGNYLKLFSTAYFTDRYDNEWGDAINFDGPDSGPAREFFVANAGYWIDEYHLDGLRLDATQAIFDQSEDHIIAAVARRVRSAGRGRITFVVGENEPQHAKLMRPAERGGYGLDALWNDDFHHTAMVALTGRHEAYYSDYRGRPSEFVAAAKYGFLYQGQRYQWQRKARGTPALDLPAESFVVFLQNHDQIANSGTGERCHALTSPGRFRAMTAYFLLMPGIPMLFQGQEFAASSPFFYFADHEIALSHDVREGRRLSLAQFPSLATSEMRPELADPGDIDTFRRSVLDLSERQCHASIYALHRDLLELRRTDPVLGQRPCRIDGAALTDEAWMLRFFSPNGADRLLIVNLGRDLLLGPAPEPLLAPVDGKAWGLLWSSEAPVYGGSGGPAQDAVGDWVISGQSATVFAPGSSITIPEEKNVFHLRETNG